MRRRRTATPVVTADQQSRRSGDGGEIRRRGAAGISGRRRLVRAWSAGASGGVSKNTCIPSLPFEKQHKASGCRFVPETEIRNPLEVTSKLDRTAVQSHPRQNP